VLTGLPRLFRTLAAQKSIPQTPCYNAAVESEEIVRLADSNPATETLFRLAPAIQKVWTIKASLAAIVVVAGVFVYDLARLLTQRGVLPFGWTIAVLAVAIMSCVALPRLRYRHWRYRLREQELFLERGIFNRVRTVVPLRRIQHLDVSQDLIEREFGLGKLIVHTAGSRSSDVVLPGLAIEDANGLRDTVKDYILEDAV
jgi:hypothetical protein